MAMKVKSFERGRELSREREKLGIFVNVYKFRSPN